MAPCHIRCRGTFTELSNECGELNIDTIAGRRLPRQLEVQHIMEDAEVPGDMPSHAIPPGRQRLLDTRASILNNIEDEGPPSNGAER